ncbi:hypothetical protein L226DRAFT_576635 [Lentinus tigrinus ALCF2SS1-7]|uniref:uncharacterized protein n=1 Tax=Lentinus tigrinus ALCF2SS1-7 TaxID=1328758 RepID=UPI001165CD61|nr:hypothetical protein L226DRAFT_576635 [Lentinus tigrinus ALCF2SS1-7]
MPVPWEALILFGLVTVMFGATGTLLNTSKRLQNQGKPGRSTCRPVDCLELEAPSLSGLRRP